MAFGLFQKTEPAGEPISLPDAKLYLRIDPSDTTDETLVKTLIKAARRHCEQYTKLALLSQSWDLWLDQIPVPRGRQSLPAWWEGARDGAITQLQQSNGMITIPKAPVISVDSITTYDMSDTAQTMDLTTLVIQLEARPPVIFPKIGQIWPVPIRPRQGIQVSFTAGYGTDGNAVPADILQAMYLLIAHFYENRSIMVESRLAETPFSVRALLDQYKILGIS